MQNYKLKFMKQKLLLILPVAGLIGYSFFKKDDNISKYHLDGIEGINFSSNPLPAKTGAPGEGKCTDCHAGTAMSAEGVVDFTLSGGPSYTPGNVYPITISTVGGAKNGFELTILDADNNQAGTFTAGANTSVVSSGGREYIRHSSSLGELSFTFNWTAPAEESGELTAYYAMNKSNNSGTNSGDEIFLGNKAIPSVFASVKENPVEEGYTAFFNSQTKELNLAYAIFNDAKVVLNVQDLSGRLVQYFDFGQQSAGNYTENLNVDKLNERGIYIVSLFVDNKVYNRKVLFE